MGSLSPAGDGKGEGERRVPAECPNLRIPSQRGLPRASSPSQSQRNFLDNSLTLQKNLPIRETQYLDTSLLKIHRTTAISLEALLAQMLAAICLNCQSLLDAVEVEDVRAKWPLTAKLFARELSSAQKTPEGAFGVGRGLTKGARTGR